MPVMENYWIDGGEADEEASQQQQSIIALWTRAGQQPII